MIIFMRQKDFLKKKKSLIMPKDYIIGDATDDTTGELQKFSNTVSLAGLKPPKPLVNGILADSDNIDPEKISKIGKRFTKSSEFRNTGVGLVSAQAKSDKNFFIVFRDKDFKAYGKNIYKFFKSKFESDEDVFFLLDDVNEKILSKKISEETRHQLDRACKKMIAKLEKDSENDQEKKDKNDKKKKKKKKKKGKKKNKYIFLDLD